LFQTGNLYGYAEAHVKHGTFHLHGVYNGHVSTTSSR